MNLFDDGEVIDVAAIKEAYMQQPPSTDPSQKIYTAGYRGRKIAEFISAVKARGAILVDIRIIPWSPNPTYRKVGLQRVFTMRNYRHVKELGNAKKDEGTIQILDMDAGVAKIREYLKLGKPLVLLCACDTYETCHRKVVADRLRELGFFVEENPELP